MLGLMEIQVINLYNIIISYKHRGTTIDNFVGTVDFQR